jgi:hypothetical protein
VFQRLFAGFSILQSMRALGDMLDRGLLAEEDVTPRARRQAGQGTGGR